MKTILTAWAATALSYLLVACGGGGPSSGNPEVVAQPQTASQAPALDAAKAFLAKLDASNANAVPPTGAEFFANRDGCYLDNGWSKASSMARFDSDQRVRAAALAYVGSLRSNVKVLADRSSTNPDGTKRREIDITYTVTYADGTREDGPFYENDKADQATLISGSSSGSKMADGMTCATAENRADFRFFGNRKVINTEVVAINDRTEWVSLATGLPMTPSVLYSRNISLRVEDPAGVATYATISGPGIVSSTTPLTPMTLKLVSPRLLRDHPLFAGKPGNILSLTDTDSFMYCQTATGYPASAESADCTAYGASATTLGVRNVPATQAAAGDDAFDNLQMVAGGVYTVKIYNDDGWKTVNGQAGKTPIATYTSILHQLPFSLVSLAGASAATDLFPRLTLNSPTPAQTAAAITNMAALIANVSWNLPDAMPDGRKLGLLTVGTGEAGPTNAGQIGTYPISVLTDQVFPKSNATSATLNFAAPGSNLALPLTAGIGLTYSNRNGNYIYSSYMFR